jgi:citronellol/citronellal dehydrogenase
MSGRFAGRRAVVTGASRGIGAAIAEQLAADGADVAIVARTADHHPTLAGSLSLTAEAMRAHGGQVVTIVADLTDDVDRARIIPEAEKALGGPIDILVNNAAVTFVIPFTDFADKRFRLMFEVQVRAPFELAQLVVPSMRARGAGWILNISSRAGIHPMGPPFLPFHTSGTIVYGMVKAALDRFSTGLAAELYADKIAVNSLSPWDNVATPGAGHHDLVDDYPLEGEEWMAEAALALCSAPPQHLTGRVAYSQPLLAELQRQPKPRR